MLILLILILILIKRLINLKGQELVNLSLLLSLALVLSLISYSFLKAELVDFGNLGTTGSDSYNYYLNALYLLDHPDHIIENFREFAGGYIIFCYLILKTSFFNSPDLIVFANILLFLNIIMQLNILLNTSSVSTKVKLLSLFLIIINGHIIWTVITILKDTFILFLVIEIFVIINSSKRKNIIKWGSVCLLIAYLQYVRPYIGLILVPLIVYSLFIKNKIYLFQKINEHKKKLIFLSIFIFLVMLVLLFKNIETITAYYNSFLIMGEESSRHSMMSYSSNAQYLYNMPFYVRVILGYFRIIFLPFPLKVLFSHDVFLTYRILAFIGSLIWWLIVWYANISVLFYRKNINKNLTILKPLLVYTFLILTTYVILYAGTASSRLRIPLYVFGTIFGVNSFFNLKLNNNKLVFVTTIFIFIMVNLLPLLINY